MLRIMRSAKDDREALEAAKAAAPYVHPRLQSVEVSGHLATGSTDDAMILAREMERAAIISQRLKQSENAIH
jgi:hypothetical protein